MYVNIGDDFCREKQNNEISYQTWSCCWSKVQVTIQNKYVTSEVIIVIGWNIDADQYVWKVFIVCDSVSYIVGAAWIFIGTVSTSVKT